MGKAQTPFMIDVFAGFLIEEFQKRFVADFLNEETSNSANMIFLTADEVSMDHISDAIVVAVCRLNGSLQGVKKDHDFYFMGTVIPPSLGPSEPNIHIGVFNDSRKGDTIYIRLCHDLD